MAVTTPTLAQRLAPAPPGFAPAAGERLLYRHRRRTPSAVYALVGAAACVLVGASTGGGPRVLLPLLAAACALAAIGVRLVRGAWIEDLVVTDRRVVRRRKDGAQEELALAESDDVLPKGHAFVFRCCARELSFPPVDAPRKVRRILAEAAPGVEVEMRFDLACPT